MNFRWELAPEQMATLERATQEFRTLRAKPNVNFTFQRNENGEVVLPEGLLLHGTRFDKEKLESISRTGILSCEYNGRSEDGETFYCADFFRVPKTQTMEEYANHINTPVAISGSVLAPKKPMEASRLPHDARFAQEQLGFIVDHTNPELQNLLANDVYRENEQFEEMKKIVNPALIKTDDSDENSLWSKRERLSAVLCGVPSNFISGIWVTEKVQNNEEQMQFLKQQFPHCSIVNSKGEILSEPNKERIKDDDDKMQ